MERKQFALFILLAVVLLAVASAPLSGQQGNNYDPWLDYNGDGKVDASDLQALGQTYGGTGDSTKNVNVTNFPYDQLGNIKVAYEAKVVTVVQNLTLTLPAGETPIANVDVTGYRYASIFVAYYDSDNVDQELWYMQSCLGIHDAGRHFLNLYADMGYHETGNTWFEIGAPSLDFSLYSIGSGTIELTVVLYCYN